jgi:hypothetical protein
MYVSMSFQRFAEAPFQGDMTHENESGTLCLLVTTEFEVLASLE